jgi:uncharacterized damage-inducible protein DinB
MSERQRILDLLDRAYRADAWHGPALLETLNGVDAALAARRPAGAAHSIWQLVDHVASWNDIVARRLRGKPPEVTDALNFPPTPEPTAAAWKASQRRLARTHAAFRREVEKFPAAKLGRTRPDTTYSWSVLIHGQIQHQLYHAGQIAMLRRMLGHPVA